MESKIRYLNDRQVAEITGLALSTLRNERFHNRGIRYAKVGRRVMYDERDVLKYMEDRKVHTQDSRAKNDPGCLISDN